MDFSNYKQFPDQFNKSEKAFQRRIRNSEGETLYFINIYEYDLSMYIPGKPLSYEGEVTISLQDGTDFKISRSIDNVNAFEQFVQFIHTKLDGGIDHHNN